MINHPSQIAQHLWATLVWLFLVPLTTTTASAFGIQPSILPTVHTMSTFPVQDCLTASVMAGLGDAIAQTNARKQYEVKRTTVFMAKGLVEGFLWYTWYKLADILMAQLMQRYFSHVQPNVMRRVMVTIVSIILDSFLASPIIFGLWDIPFPALVQKTTSWPKVGALVRAKLPAMILAYVKVWTPVNIFVYNIPLAYRVTFVSVADVFWQSIASTMTATSEDNEEIDRNMATAPKSC